MPYSPEERFVRWRTTALIVWAAIGVLVLLGALWGSNGGHALAKLG